MKPIIKFYRQLKQALFVHDVYAPMFFCDFINMGIVIAFYSQFGVSICKRLFFEKASDLRLFCLESYCFKFIF